MAAPWQKRPQRRSATSAPKAECARQRHAAPSQPQVRGRTIPVAVKTAGLAARWGCCSYVDRGSGRRCGSWSFRSRSATAPTPTISVCSALPITATAIGRRRRADRAAVRP